MREETVAHPWHLACNALQTTCYGDIMELMAKSWTDERLEERFDAIDQRFDGVDQRFDRVDAGIRDLRVEMNARFDRMDERMDTRFARMDGRFERMDARFEAMQRLMIQVGAVIVAALIGLIATQL